MDSLSRNNKTKISVIIPVYNTERFLPQCIDSILSQTFVFFELLLIDDGSTDTSGLVCDEYARKDKRIKVFHKENEGVSLARNFGLDHAKGEYVCFVDSDDWVEVDYLEFLVSNIGKADILFFSFFWHYEDGCVQAVSPGNFQADETTRIYESILHLKKNNLGVNFFGFTWNKIFKMEVIQKHGIRFIRNLNVSEDEIFTLSYCLQAKSTKVCSKPIYNYRWRKNGLTHASRTMNDWLLLFSYIEELIPLINYECLRTEETKWALKTLINACKDTHHIQDFIRCQYKAYRYARKNNMVRLYVKTSAKNTVAFFFGKAQKHLTPKREPSS